MTKTLDMMVQEVRRALATQLRVRGATLDAQLRKAGRDLPRGVRQHGDFLVKSVAMSAHPKLARRIDMRRAAIAHRRILQHLDTVDVGAARRDRAVQVAGSIALALLVTGVMVIAVLAWRGFI
ncbi:MAG: hypothetical protein ACSHW1_10675 [Yoonia sp.]|uniref:hypothetical protein n=1 Tax=Yoonia sp. TaxID=2212373 RepID=UPI003EF3D135